MSAKDDNLSNQGPIKKKHKNDSYNMAAVEQAATESSTVVDDHESSAQAPPRFFSTASAPAYLRNKMLYERKPVTDLWNKLTTVAKPQWKWRATTEDFLNSKQRVLQVYGPPDTGKSSATFYWVLRVCTDLGAKGLWIDCSGNRQESESWSIDKEEQGTAVQVSEIPTVPSKSNAAETADSFHIVVFDRVREATLEDWRNFFNDLARRGVFVIVVSSEGVRMHHGNANDLLNLNHFVSSWTKDEYYASCSSDAFWTNCCEFFDGASATDSYETRKKLLDEKFKVSGQSARYMFAWDSNQVKSRITDDAARMGGITALEFAARSNRSSGAVNSLISRTRENGATPKDQARFPTLAELAPPGATEPAELRFAKEEEDPVDPRCVARIVSSFASEEVVKQLPSDIAKLRGVARDLQNQVIEGYALEEQLKESLKDGRNPGVGLPIEINGVTIILPVAKFLECTKDQLESELACAHLENTWIFVGQQQGAFGAVHLHSSNSIRFVQTTAAAKHTFKLDVIAAMLRRLATNYGRNWGRIEFMVMRPIDDYRQFALGKAQGSLYGQGYTRFDGQLWNQSNFERDNVVYSRLAWRY